MKIIKLILILLILTLIFSSCSVILSKMYGIKMIKQFNEQNYLSFISKIREEIDFSDIVSDSIQYTNVMNIVKNVKYKQYFGQPVQILFFEKNKIKSFHVNCSAKGKLTNLNWNTEDRFLTFPPKSAINIDSLYIELEDYNKIYKGINLNSNKNYTVIIFWTFLLEKISYSAIQTVIENINNFDKLYDTNIYLINTDKYFASVNQ